MGLRAADSIECQNVACNRRTPDAARGSPIPEWITTFMRQSVRHLYTNCLAPTLTTWPKLAAEAENTHILSLSHAHIHTYEYILYILTHYVCVCVRERERDEMRTMNCLFSKQRTRGGRGSGESGREQRT